MVYEVGTFIAISAEHQHFDIGQVMQVDVNKADIPNSEIFVHWYEAVHNYLDTYKDQFRPRGKFRRFDQPVASYVKFRQVLYDFETLSADEKLEDRTIWQIKKAIKHGDERAPAAMALISSA